MLVINITWESFLFCFVFFIYRFCLSWPISSESESWGWCTLWGPGNICFLRERNGMKEKVLLQRFWWKSSLRNYPFRWQDYCQACYPCPSWRQWEGTHLWASQLGRELCTVFQLWFMFQQVASFSTYTRGMIIQMVGQVSLNFTLLEFPRVVNRNIWKGNTCFGQFPPPNQIFTDGERDHLVLPYSWTLRTVCSVTFVWNCKEIKLRTVALYMPTVCLPDRTWVGLLWDLFWTRPRCHSNPGQLRSVSGRVLVDQFSENLPSSTCDWIPHPPPWMCYRPCHQPLPALCKIPVELFHQEPPAQNSLCASFTGGGPNLSTGEPHIQQVSESRFLDDTQVELHTG